MNQAMNQVRNLFLLLSLLIASEKSFGQEIHSLIQQPRTWAMGGAGIALADDEYALFNNVAGLAGNETADLKLIGLGMESSWDVYSSFSESLSAMRSFSATSLNVLMGKDIRLRIGGTPILRFKHLTLAYVMDAQFAFVQSNPINPIFKLGAMQTHGVQVGYGYNIKHGKKPVDEWRIGLATKILWRKGGYYSLSAADLLVASTAKLDYVESLVGPFSIGLGLDAGTQYVYHLDKQSDISAGMTLTDIADTKFQDKRGMTIPMDWGFGVAYKTNFTPFTFAVDLDYRNILTAYTFTNRLHLGFDIGLPLLNLYAGLNQLYLTYGFAFDLWLLKFTVMSYGQETGISYHQNPSRRYVFQIDFKLPI